MADGQEVRESEPKVQTTKPKVSLGLPVYNGENYLETTLKSILSQTYKDFELVISDNASEDATADIIKKYAENDSRIRYYRQSENIGAAANYDYVFMKSEGEYFKWCAHDDVFGEEFLEVCVDWLDAHQDYVGALPDDVWCVNADGDRYGQRITFDLDPKGAGPADRFKNYLSLGWINCSPFFGLYRRDHVKKSGLHGDYLSSDRVFIGEMLLRGRFALVSGSYFHFRMHDEQFSRQIHNDETFATSWLNPNQKWTGQMDRTRCSIEYFRAIRRSKLSSVEQRRARKVVFKYIWSNRSRIAKELCLPVFRNGRLKPGVRRFLQRVGLRTN